MMNNSKPVLSSNPALNVLKTIGSSPLFLIAAILYTLVIMLPLVFVLSGGADMQYMLNLFFGEAVNLPQTMGMDSELRTFARIVFAVSTVLTGLTCVGMWITWATCRNRSSGNISTAGLSLCKGVVIFRFVIFCLAILAFIIGEIIAIVTTSNLSNMVHTPSALGEGSRTVAIVILVIISIVFLGGGIALNICFYVSELRLINRLKAVARTGIPDNRVSTFLLVMLYLTAIPLVLYGLLFLFFSPLLGSALLAGGAASILIAVTLTKYRKGMTLLMYPPVQPVYAQPYPQAGAQPYPPQQEQPWSPPAAPYAPQAPAQPQAPAEPQAPVEPQAPAEPEASAESDEPPQE